VRFEYDDMLVLHGDNYENQYPGCDVGSTDYSELPVDYLLCQGECVCVLRFYCLGFQNEMWQATRSVTAVKRTRVTNRLCVVCAHARSLPSQQVPLKEVRRPRQPRFRPPRSRTPKLHPPRLWLPPL
jgi:hypothetical protein